MSHVVIYKNVHYFIQRERAFPTAPSQGPRTEAPPGARPASQGPSRGQSQGPGSPPSQRPKSQVTAEAGTEDPTDAARGKDTNASASPTDASSPTSSSSSSTSSSSTSPSSPNTKEDPEDTEHLSVIIFGTDSASRLNMRRHLPKTYQYLTEELGAVDLGGFNKVGDNTFPNLVPVMIGLSSAELSKHKCVPAKEKFDDCPWVWKDFKRKGYATAYMEDSPWMGIFNYMHNGFVTPPTDYYGRAFFLASEKEIGREKHGNRLPGRLKPFP
ncbi:uncharacterized protein LOC119591840 [Penaeus monodon]|uniref:uncharacterized protein LOC119591840 n=1 Tax=Penaeus monodon TaxID=6687 RepID=UPI0018A754CD|nr:uncharacterized protein LOC119591840 [Penaeus monodon]